MGDGMARRRFRKGETYTVDQAVEVRNGRHWHAATVTGSLEYDDFGVPYYRARVLKSRGTVLAGDAWLGYPDGIRAVAPGPGGRRGGVVTELEPGRAVPNRLAAGRGRMMRRRVAVVAAGLAAVAVLAVGGPVGRVAPARAATSGGVVTLMAAGDVAPDPGETERGDMATAALVERERPGLVLGLGDMQYNYGEYAAFSSSRGYDGSWGRFKGITRPVPGNHDYGQTRRTGGSGYYRYFGKQAGPAGKGWYSFNVGGWHVVALNSTCGFEGGPSCGRGSEQVRWLQRDLAAHRNRCTLAYWHHPRFTGYAKANTSGEALRSRWFVNALYAAGADVILTGHLHSYERTTGLTASGKVSPNRGMRHFIVGTGGEDPSKPTPAAPGRRAAVNYRYGALRLELGAGWWRSSFLTTKGETLDRAAANCV